MFLIHHRVLRTWADIEISTPISSQSWLSALRHSGALAKKGRRRLQLTESEKFHRSIMLPLCFHFDNCNLADRERTKSFVSFSSLSLIHFRLRFAFLAFFSILNMLRTVNVQAPAGSQISTYRTFHRQNHQKYGTKYPPYHHLRDKW